MSDSIKAGSWVVVGEHTVAMVAEVIDEKVFIQTESLFGPMKTLCPLKDVRPWSPSDAREGDILYGTLEEDLKTRVVFIMLGHEDAFECAAVCSVNSEVPTIDITIGCSIRIYKDSLRPAMWDERQMLEMMLKKHGKRWDRDRKVLEDLPKPAHIISKERVLTEEIDRLEKRCDNLQKQVDILVKKVKELEERV